jgi:hypothetical protein
MDISEGQVSNITMADDGIRGNNPSKDWLLPQDDLDYTINRAFVTV